MVNLNRQLSWINFDMALVSLGALVLSAITVGSWIPLMFQNPDGWQALAAGVAGALYFAAFLASGPLILLNGQAERMIAFYGKT